MWQYGDWTGVGEKVLSEPYIGSPSFRALSPSMRESPPPRSFPTAMQPDVDSDPGGHYLGDGDDEGEDTGRMMGQLYEWYSWVPPTTL